MTKLIIVAGVIILWVGGLFLLGALLSRAADPEELAERMLNDYRDSGIL